MADRNYTQNFGGTSSVAPLAAGVIALMLEANPNLGWRDVPEILIRSATKVDPTDADWSVNAAGFHVNHNYGAGMVNAADAVDLARTWKNRGPAGREDGHPVDVQSRDQRHGGSPKSSPSFGKASVSA